jgi:hypothetical protein
MILHTITFNRDEHFHEVSTETPIFVSAHHIVTMYPVDENPAGIKTFICLTSSNIKVVESFEVILELLREVEKDSCV